MQLQDKSKKTNNPTFKHRRLLFIATGTALVSLFAIALPSRADLLDTFNQYLVKFEGKNPTVKIFEQYYPELRQGNIFDYAKGQLQKMLGKAEDKEIQKLLKASLGALGLPDPGKLRKDVNASVQNGCISTSSDSSTSSDPSHTTDPGTDSSTCSSDHIDPGSTNPGSTNPGSTNPGSTNPGTTVTNGNPADDFDVNRVVYSAMAQNESDRQAATIAAESVLGSDGQKQGRAELDQMKQLSASNISIAKDAQGKDVTQDVMKNYTQIAALNTVVLTAIEGRTLTLHQDNQYISTNLVDASRTLDEMSRNSRVESAATAMSVMEVSGQAKLY